MTRDGFDLEVLDRYLDEKDETLLRHHEARLADVSRPPSYLPSSRTSELYDRLAELEASGAKGEDLDSVWSELRQLQSEEAARFEAYFDAHVLEPLREGHTELDHLEKLLTER